MQLKFSFLSLHQYGLHQYRSTKLIKNKILAGKIPETWNIFIVQQSLSFNPIPGYAIDLDLQLQSVSWILAEFCYNRSPQGPYTGTCTILQETINGFLCPLIVFRKM